MTCTKTENDGVVQLKIEGDLLIPDVAALREDIRSGLACADTVAIDLGDVSEIDTAGIQLLLATVRSTSALGKSVTLENNPQLINSAALRLGLNPAELTDSLLGGK